MEGPVEPAAYETAIRYELACRAAGIGVWKLHVAEDRLVYCKIASSIFGFPEEGPITREMVYSAIHPDDAEVVRLAAQRAMDPQVRSTESDSYSIRRFDTGERRWLIGNGIAFFDQIGPAARPLLYAGLIRDVTERELIREGLAASEERIRMAVWDLHLETRTVAHSPDLNRMLGFLPAASPSLEELRSRYAPGERERLDAEGAAATARRETSLQSRVRYNIPGKGEVIYALRAALANSAEGTEPGRRVIGVL